MCIDIVEIWFGIANGQYSLIFTELSAHETSVVSFQENNLNKFQWSFTKLDMCIDIVEIWFGVAYRQISSILVELSARERMMAGYYRFTFYWCLGRAELRDSGTSRVYLQLYFCCPCRTKIRPILRSVLTKYLLNVLRFYGAVISFGSCLPNHYSWAGLVL